MFKATLQALAITAALARRHRPMPWTTTGIACDGAPAPSTGKTSQFRASSIRGQRS